MVMNCNTAYAKVLAAAFASAMLVCTPAQAATVLFDDFESEPVAENVTALSNFSLPEGPVDVVEGGFFGPPCSGHCVELEGDVGYFNHTLQTRTFGFNAGDTVSISFDLSSDSLGDPSEGYGFYLQLGGRTSLSNLSHFYDGVLISSIDNINPSFYSVGTSLPRSIRRNQQMLTFVSNDSGNFFFEVNQFPGSDGGGLYVDNFRIDIDAAAAVVPEPASWALMIAGFGFVGGALRRSSNRRAGTTVKKLQLVCRYV